MALKSLSSGIISISSIGVTLPTNISPALAKLPFLIIPLLSKFLVVSAFTYGKLFVNFSVPPFVSFTSKSFYSELKKETIKEDDDE